MKNSVDEAKTPPANVSSGKDSSLNIPDTVDLETGRYNGLHEAAEHLRELARDYATRAARLDSDGSEAALNIASEYRAKAALLRECADTFDSRVPRAGLPLSPLPITQAGTSAAAQTQDVIDESSLQPEPIDKPTLDFIDKIMAPPSESESSISSTLAEIKERRSKVPEPPWFVGSDRAKDAPPHTDSGLALVDTGRESDWPIARLCEWPQAEFIAQAPADIDTLLGIIDSLQAEVRKLADLPDGSLIELAPVESAGYCPGCGTRVVGHNWTQCMDKFTAASNMKAAIVKRVREIIRGGFPEDVHVYTDQVLAEIEKVATEIEAVEPDDLEVK